MGDSRARAMIAARRRAVHDLAGLGWSNAEIARALGVSVRTVFAHREHLRLEADAVRVDARALSSALDP